MDIYLIKHQGVFSPVSQEDQESADKIPEGEVTKFKSSKVRNLLFHRKFFALLNHAYEAFEPVDNYHKGVMIEKNFDQFRKDVIIMAGFYDAVPSLNGGLRLKAKSISFGRMTEEEFTKLYNSCFKVILDKVLRNYTKDDLDMVINELMRF